MIEKKIIEAKKQEFDTGEFIKKWIGKGKVSEVKIERTPVGEKIVIITSKPGLVIGQRGETIHEMTNLLKKQFGLENPQIEISELTEPIFDAKTVADQIAMSLEKFGPLGFKLVAYKKLEQILQAGALGAEIRLGGKLPSERAKSWRFAFGYMKKTGGGAAIANRAKAQAFTRPGVIGIKVAIVPKDTRIPDKIEINKTAIEAELAKLKELIGKEEEKLKENGNSEEKRTEDAER